MNTTASPLGRLLLALGTSRDLWAERQAPAGEDNENRDQEEADSVVETLDGILTEAFTSGREWHETPLILVVGRELAQMIYDGVELLQPDGCHAQACQAQLLREFCEYLEKGRAMADLSPFPPPPPLTVTTANVAALRSTLAAAVEDLDHWEHNGSADETESQEARRAVLDNAQAFIERLATVASAGLPDPDEATDEDRVAAVLEINDVEADNMGSEVADYMVRAAQCSTKSGLREIIKEAGPIPDEDDADEAATVAANVEQFGGSAGDDFAHLPENCPSNHWNRGDDICGDCGEDLN